MPKCGRKHRHDWPEDDGELDIQGCERLCGYCVHPKDQHKFHDATTLRNHVYTIHISPKNKNTYATHPNIHLLNYRPDDEETEDEREGRSTERQRASSRLRSASAKAAKAAKASDAESETEGAAIGLEKLSVSKKATLKKTAKTAAPSRPHRASQEKAVKRPKDQADDADTAAEESEDHSEAGEDIMMAQGPKLQLRKKAAASKAQTASKAKAMKKAGGADVAADESGDESKAELQLQQNTKKNAKSKRTFADVGNYSDGDLDEEIYYQGLLREKRRRMM